LQKTTKKLLTLRLRRALPCFPGRRNVTQTIEFIFDFASPNAYLAYRALPGVLARTAADLVLTPCLLGGIFRATGNQAPMLAYAGVKGKLDYMMLEMQRFMTRHQVTKFRMNPHFPVNSLLLMRGMLAVSDAQRPAYVEAVLAAMWEDGRALADPAVVAGVLRDAGLNADEILAGAQTEPVKQALAANTQAAVERGVFGIPTFFVGAEMFFGKDSLAPMEHYLLTGLA
jgi:2-hydroxychromene-2-carboxylate isomerase